MNSKRIKYNSFIFLQFIFAATLIFTSCRAKKKIEKSPAAACSLPPKSANLLSDSLKKHQFNFKTLSAKFEAEAAINDDKHSFTVNMRMSKDSIIWMQITAALGIPVARAFVTKDSVKFINQLNSTYFKGDFNYVSKLLQADLDFEMLQALLVGNNVDFDDSPERLRSSIRDCKYLLSTVRRRKLKRVIDKNKELKDPVQTIWLDPLLFRINRVLFNEFNTNRTFDASFTRFEPLESTTFPYSIKFDIKAEKNVVIAIEYEKVTLNKEISYPFSIPEKYERIIYKEK